MRYRLVALLVLAWPWTAAAQSATPVPSQAVPLPRIGLPLPRIGLPLAPIGVPRSIDRRPSAGVSRPVVPAPGAARHGRRGRRGQGTAVLIVPGYGWPYPGGAPSASPAPSYEPIVRVEPVERRERHEDVRPDTGVVRIDVPMARDAQIFVDGYFAGTLEEAAGELTLASGPHRIELRTPGAEPLAFDVLVTAGRSITYRDTAPRVSAAPQASSQTVTPTAPSVVYFIPGCYLGNVPPKDAGLPASCDVSRVTTFDTGR